MPLKLIDTHCHIHEIEEALTPVHDKWSNDGVERSAEGVIFDANSVGVVGLICIGTSLADSKHAVSFAQQHKGVWATIAIHPHDASKHDLTEVKTVFTNLLRVVPIKDKIVGVGECGLDYFYGHSGRDSQLAFLRMHLELAQKFDLPLSFHVRGSQNDPGKDAFADFWPIFDEYNAIKPLRGVMHSFTDTMLNLSAALKRGLYIGVNGIATFVKSEDQLKTYRAIPNDRLLLETDAPFLTPVPFRGKICEPKHAAITLEFLADLRGQTSEDLAGFVYENSVQLFGLEVQ